MFFIIFYCIPLFLFAWLSNNPKFKGGGIFKVVLILFVSSISVLTAPVATDHNNYVQIYEYARRLSLVNFGFSYIGASRVSQIEPGYMLFNWLISRLGLTEPFFFFIVALLMNTVIVYFVYKHRLPILSLLYLYIGGLLLINEQNLVRQFLASSFFLCALLILENCQIKHRRLKYLLLIILASLFHTSAVILLLFVIIDNDNYEYASPKTNNRDKIARIVMSGIYIFSLLSIVFPVLAHNIVFSSLFIFYDNYQNTESGIGMSAAIIYVLFYNIIAIIALYYYKKSSRILATCAIMMAVVYNLSFSVPNVLRLQTYFLVPTIVYVCHCLLSSPERQQPILGNNLKKIAILVLGFYLVESAFNNFVLHDTVLLSDTYKVIDFFPSV